jgi:hypothetical protein
VPVNPVARVKGRFSRRLSDGKRNSLRQRILNNTSLAGHAPAAEYSSEPFHAALLPLQHQTRAALISTVWRDPGITRPDRRHSLPQHT